MANFNIGENKEIVLSYENDFLSDDAMKNVTVVHGEMKVENGALRTVSDTGISTALFEVPNSGNFVLEADFLDHQKGGGIMFGGAPGRAKTSTPEEDRTSGYYACVSHDGTTGAIGCTSTLGKWNGNFNSGRQGRFEVGTDISFYLRVSGDYIIYLLKDKNSGEEIYRVEYKKGDSKHDASPFGGGSFAVRMNNDGGVGGFTNIKTYRMKKAEMSEAELGVSQKLTASLTAKNNEEMVVFAKDGQGFAFSYDGATERLVAYRYLHGNVYYLAQHAMQITPGKEYAFSAVNRGDVLAFYFGDQTYPVLEVQLRKKQTFNIGSTSNTDITVEDTELYSGPTYTNPVTYGADPEILYHDGVFYLYTLDTTTGSCKVRVRTSTDLVEWKEAGFAFGIDKNSPIHFFMSPNVFHKDGYFYLLIASQFGGAFGATDFRIFYASATSPAGPFVMDPEKPYINTVAEIGGAPFVDDDGRVYITTVRFGGGNHIYIQELNAEKGVLSTKREAVHCVSPTEHYEIDEYGHISEGGVIIKHNGYYYMMYAAGHFRGHYGEAYAVSKDIYGPYTKYKYNEVLSSNMYVDGAGDCMFIVCPEMDEIFVVYHKHAAKGNKGYDRDICIDRVYFVPAEDGGPDVMRVYGPTDTPTPVPVIRKK